MGISYGFTKVQIFCTLMYQFYSKAGKLTYMSVNNLQLFFSFKLRSDLNIEISRIINHMIL